MDFYINLVIIGFITVAILETLYYGHRVSKSYNGILRAINQFLKDLKNLLVEDSPETEESESIEIDYNEEEGKKEEEEVEEEDSTEYFESFIQNVNNIFTKQPALVESWKNYKRKLRYSEDEIYSLVNSGEFFSRDKLINLNTKNHDRIKALPGLLTAWGLLGTFVAILMGLKGIDPNNIDTINQLVHGLFAKFFSSIVALFCSICFVFYERGLYSKIGFRCTEMQRSLEDIFPTVSGNEILSNLEMNMQLQANTMGALSKSLAKNSLESIEKMVNMFRDTLTEGTAQQFKDISTMVTNLANMMKGLQNNQETFMERMDTMNQQSETLAGQHKQMLEAITESLNEIEKKVELFKTAIDKSKKAYESLSDVTENIAKAGDQFASLAPSINENNNSIRDLTNNLNQSVSYFNSITNELSNSKLDVLIHKFGEGIQSSLTDIQKGLNEDLDIIKEGYQWHDKQLTKLIETTTDNIEKIHYSMSDFSEKTSNFLAGYDESIAKAISYLNTNVHTMDNSLKDNIKTLENNFVELNKTLNSINNNLNDEV